MCHTLPLIMLNHICALHTAKYSRHCHGELAGSITLPRSQQRGRGRKRGKKSQHCSKLSPPTPNSPTCHWHFRSWDLLTSFQNRAGSPMQITSHTLRGHTLPASSMSFWLTNPEAAPLLCVRLHSCWHWPGADGYHRKALPACNICLKVIPFLQVIPRALLTVSRSSFCHHRSSWHCSSSSLEAVKCFWSPYFMITL